MFCSQDAVTGSEFHDKIRIATIDKRVCNGMAIFSY
jgi:hypothetical protein